ncbi:MAG: tetratricopeptide repeat protein, partial [Persicimonas sp.]
MADADHDRQAPTFDEAREEIDELLSQWEFDEARNRLEEAYEAHGVTPELRVLEAEIALEEDDWEGCLEVVDETLDEVDDDQLYAQLAALKGYALYYLDRLEEARKTFNAAVHADPESWTALVGRATVHEYLDFEHAALLDLHRAIELDDQEPEPFAIRGMIRLRRGELEEAKLDLGYALDFDPYDEESRLNYARLQAVEGDSAGARETLEPLVEEGEDPEFVVRGALLRSQLALGLQSADAAASDAEVAIELRPDEPWGYLALAAAHITGGDGGEAIAALKEAEKRMEHPSHFPDLYALRASAYEQVGKPEKARAAREEAQGAARLPEFVYGEHLNPSKDVPVNPNKPIDVRNLMRQIFGDPQKAPEGYEEALRQVIDQIPAYIEQNP